MGNVCANCQSYKFNTRFNSCPYSSCLYFHQKSLFGDDKKLRYKEFIGRSDQTELSPPTMLIVKNK